MRPFPKLMCSKVAPDDFIVYFQNPNSGMVVHSGEGMEWPLGTIQITWDPNMFEDIAQDRIVWLTEGPPEPIHEAVEMIEKLRLSRP
jgi:hypothetical protein